MDHLPSSEVLVFALKASATVSCSLFFGAATYVNVVEVPARASIKSGVEFLVDHFQSTFPRAKAFQGSLAVISFLTSGTVYLLTPNDLASKYFLAGGLAMITCWPWTFYAIMPINYKLMDGDAPKKKGEDYVRGLLSSWNKVHAVRSVLSGLALAAFIGGFYLK